MGELLEVLKGIEIPSSAQKIVDDADALYSKRREDASYVDHLETEIKNLKAELEQLRSEKGIASESGGLAFDETSGTYIEQSSGLHYCTKCLSDKKRSPLKGESQGWVCVDRSAQHHGRNSHRDRISLPLLV